MKSRKTLRHWTLVVFASLAIVCLAGCIYQKSVLIRETGPMIDSAQLGLVEPGRTTRQQLVDMFGPPTKAQKAPDGSETLEYVLVRRTTTSESIFMVFSSDKKETGGRVVSFEIRNGVLQRFWQKET